MLTLYVRARLCQIRDVRRPCSCSCVTLEGQRQREVARASVVEFLVSVGAEEKSPVGSDGGLPRWS